MASFNSRTHFWGSFQAQCGAVQLKCLNLDELGGPVSSLSLVCLEYVAALFLSTSLPEQTPLPFGFLAQSPSRPPASHHGLSQSLSNPVTEEILLRVILH